MDGFHQKFLYTNDIPAQVAEMMSRGKVKIQVAAALHISKDTFNVWLQHPNPMYDEFRRAYEIGLTKCEAYWIEKGQQGMLREIKLESMTYKLFMTNLFGWSERHDTTQNTKIEQKLSTEELDERIKHYFDKGTELPRETGTSHTS